MLGARTGRLGEEVFVVDDGMERARERATAIEGFVDRLTRVREAAGDPSFRLMAKRSGAISHATLHDAVQGARLPSWTTVVEFAKACGADPDQLRAAWEQAERVISASGVPDPEIPAAQSRSTPEQQAAPEPAAPDPTQQSAAVEDEPADDVRPAHRPDDLPEPTPPRPTRPAPALLAGAAALGAALSLGAVAAYGALAEDDERPPASALTRSAGQRGAGVAATTSSLCPTNTATHDPGLDPRNPADGAKKGGETPADCGVYGRGETVTKTWEVKNTGTLTWEGRSMRRIDPLLGKFGCTTPETVPIPRTAPGETAKISVKIRTRTTPGTCYVRWMIVDRDGKYAFPGQRPIYFTLRVR